MGKEKINYEDNKYTPIILDRYIKSFNFSNEETNLLIREYELFYDRLEKAVLDKY